MEFRPPRPIINLGPAMRFVLGLFMIGGFCLLVLSLEDTWWRVRAQLNGPYGDGAIVNLYGGIALSFKQSCPLYQNTTFASGQPLVAPLQCYTKSFHMDDATTREQFNTQYNRGIIATIAVSMAVCLFGLYINVVAPSEYTRKRPQFMTDVDAMLTYTVEADGSTQIRAAAPSAMLPCLRCCARGHHVAKTCLPLHIYLPVLFAPCLVVLGTLSSLWATGADDIPSEQLILDLSNVSCTTACSSYTTIPGPGLVGALAASMCFFFVSTLASLAWCFPVCCPSLLLLAVSSEDGMVSSLRFRSSLASVALRLLLGWRVSFACSRRTSPSRAQPISTHSSHRRCCGYTAARWLPRHARL